MAVISSLVTTLRSENDGETIRLSIAQIMELINADNNTILDKLSDVDLDVIVAASDSALTTLSSVQTLASQVSVNATNAANSATAANTSAIAAATSKTNASTSATNAATSAAAALTSETNALASKNAASISETNAATSAAAANTSATDAANSATAAAESLAAIDDAETNAEASAIAANTSATNAANSATNAYTSEMNALDSQNAAATSETNAASSATAAHTSATNAATSETNAATSATNASTSETNAAQAAIDAATSLSNLGDAETNAAASAAAAAISETNAATSEANAAQSAIDAANAASSLNVTAEDITSWNAKQDALGFTPENIANKGVANGYASLDANGLVPETQMPNITNPDNMSKSTYDTNQNGIVDNAEKVNGHTVESDVPASAAFTDTTYNAATQSSDGLLSAADKTKLDAITGTGTMTAAEILTELITVDGSGSELDADKLDGMDSTEFAPTNHGTHVTFGTGITALESGVAGITGIAETVSRSDHTHTLPAYPDLAGHAANTDIHVTADDQAEWNQNTTDIAALYVQTGTLGANDETARKEILEIKIKLDELNVAEFLNKTGIGFFDLFEDNSNIDTTNTTATVADTDVSFSGEQLLKFNDETFESFSDLELAVYDLERELFEVDVDVSTSATISMNITPGSRVVGEKFWFNGQIYTITGVTES